MKIAVSSKGVDLDSQVDPRFGRCENFIITDENMQQIEVIDNTARTSQGGAGTLASTLISDGGAGIILTGNVGPNAFRSLHAAGIEIFTGAEGTIREAVKDYLNGKLTKTFAPTSKGKH